MAVRRLAEKNENPTLNKYLADAGLCSRRKAVDLIKEGKVTVNGATIKEPGHRVEAAQEVRVSQKVVKPAKKIYVLFNKPSMCLTTLVDPRGRRTIMDLVELPTKDRIYHVGRLDYETTGLILLTNDGELAQKLSHPSNNVKKIYHVTLDKGLEVADLLRLKEGIDLSDGKVSADEVFYLGKRTRNPVSIEIHSGKNRVIRRMFKTIGYNVLKLDRACFAGLTKRELPKGRWRYLNAAEVNFLHTRIW